MCSFVNTPMSVLPVDMDTEMCTSPLGARSHTLDIRGVGERVRSGEAGSRWGGGGCGRAMAEEMGTGAS